MYIDIHLYNIQLYMYIYSYVVIVMNMRSIYIAVAREEVYKAVCDKEHANSEWQVPRSNHSCSQR